MLYFAYGSNLDPEQMRSRCPGHQIVGLGALRDHRMIFPLTSPTWGGGVAGVQGSRGSTVWGMVFELGSEDVASLDVAEGFKGPGDQHNVYDREFVFVELTRPDHGSIPRRVRAACYLARPTNPGPPSRRYLDTIVRGAKHHRLPEEYVAALEKIPTAD